MSFSKSLLASALIGFSFLISAHKTIIRPAVGDIAPEISLRNINGDTISLSSLRGKVVYIDFWASWCGRCRVENKTIREAYKNFNSKKFSIGNGFDVFSVSLDTDSSQWDRAIQKDQLIWENHVCDFKKWESPLVEKYNFRYLPHNLVIDNQGVIVAKGLFGSKLEEFL
ncbi:MAG: TlpA family protein disulfide reductase, partial [Bacteroidia bacterium]